MDSELFGELHHQDEDSLHGERHKREQLNKIGLETSAIYKWECPCCSEEHYSEEEETLEDFSESLYVQGVRFKVMKYMQGVFCKDCWTDPEVQNSSL